MPTKELVTKVWIEPGCIVCDACENTSPTVFEVTDDTCIIRPAALNAEFTKPLTQEIIDAAEECPVDVIKFETKPVEISEQEAAAMEAAGTGEPAASGAPEPVGAGAAVQAEASGGATAAAAERPKPAHKPAAAAAKAEPAAKDEAKPAAAAKSPIVPAADIGDPTMQALLRAARSRGGQAGILKKGPGQGAVSPLDKKDPSELPPDARFVKTLEAVRKGKDGEPTRREAIAKSGLALAVGWGSFAAFTGASTLAFSRFMMPNALEEPDPRVRVGPLKIYAEMKPGEVNEDYKPKGIWLIREEDRIAALSIICTHLGCIPNWLPNDRKFLCPCHGSGYYFNGINFQGPTPRPLERFKITLVDGIVVVDKSKKFQYELGQWSFPEASLAV